MVIATGAVIVCVQVRVVQVSWVVKVYVPASRLLTLAVAPTTAFEEFFQL